MRPTSNLFKKTHQSSSNARARECETHPPHIDEWRREVSIFFGFTKKGLKKRRIENRSDATTHEIHATVFDNEIENEKNANCTRRKDKFDYLNSRLRKVELTIERKKDCPRKYIRSKHFAIHELLQILLTTSRTDYSKSELRKARPRVNSSENKTKVSSLGQHGLKADYFPQKTVPK